MTNKATMAWVDLETTGLSASLDVPLELGIILTDDHLVEVAREEWFIWEPNDKAFMASVHRGHQNQFVEPMHRASGLWDDLESGTWMKDSRVEVDTMICQFLQDNGVKYGTLPMCGNSIGSLDRPFTIVHFPMFNEALNYRNIDISSFKEVCKLVNPELYENLKPIIGTKADATHRVMDDISASIREYQAYLENFIITGDNY